jgi:hypothetical protein
MDETGVACSTHEDIRSVYKILIGNLKRSYFSQGLGVDRRIILKWNLKKYVGMFELESSGSR